MKSLKFACDHCVKEVEVPMTHADSWLPCPNCSEIIRAPHVVTAHEEPAPQDQDSTTEQTGSGKRPCPFCGEMILSVAIKCKHCKSDLQADPHAANKLNHSHEQSSSTTNNSSSPLMILVLLSILLVLFFSNFHIITGERIGPKIVRRDAFGFSEIFINVDAITGMPWISAKSRYPIGCRVLAREGIIESDEALKSRVARELQQDFDSAVEDTKKMLEDVERLMRDLKR